MLPELEIAKSGPCRRAMAIAESDNWDSPLSWLQLFYQKTVWSTWARETNRYAKEKGASETDRGWYPGPFL